MRRGDKSTEHFENLKKTAKDLEDMLLSTSTSDSSILSVAKTDDILPRLKAIRPLDYDAVKEDADNKAEDIVDSVALLYLPQEFIADHDYVFQKMEVDKLTVSSLIFQMKTAEHAIKKLLEEIDSGSIRDRSFEVLASLQKSKMEIVKHLAQFMVVMENNYKNLKFDYYNNLEKDKEAETEVGEATVVSEESTKFRGTKGLMGMVQQYIEQGKNGVTNTETNDESSNEIVPGE